MDDDDDGDDDDLGSRVCPCGPPILRASVSAALSSYYTEMARKKEALTSQIV